MIVFAPVKFSLDALLKRSAFYATVSSLVVFVILLGLLFLYPSGPSVDVALPQTLTTHTNKRSFPYELIGSGPLALRPSHALGWVARLADELALIAYNSRPDSDPKQAEILLRLKQGKVQQEVVNGKSFYLKECEEGKGLLFSDEPAAFSVKPILLDGGSILLEVGRKIVSKEGIIGEEKGQFIASLQGLSLGQSLASSAFIQDLKGAHFYSQDLFLQRYAGQEYGDFARKAVLDVTTQWGSYGLFVSPGDYLLYEEKEWRPSDFQDLKPGFPVAYVRSISEKGVEIDIWDEKGFSPLQIKTEHKRQQRPPFGPESMPSSIRLRTGTQVNCAFGKRRLILKQGDWLLKTANGYRNLRNLEDVELYLERRLKGDLFVFEALEKDPQGKFTMKGYLFDDTRTYIQPVVLPVNVDKQQNKSSRKRRSAALNGNRGMK